MQECSVLSARVPPWHQLRIVLDPENTWRGRDVAVRSPNAPLVGLFMPPIELVTYDRNHKYMQSHGDLSSMHHTLLLRDMKQGRIFKPTCFAEDG